MRKVGNRRPSGDSAWIVLDAIDNFDGLERLIVIAAGLDENMLPGKSRRLASRFYRAITRAHMLVYVVNEELPNGMLNFIRTIGYDESEVRKR